MKQTICSVGDAILLERFPASYDTSPIENIVKKADARLFNLENVLSDRQIYASSYCGGTWLLAKEDTLDDTLRFGFNGCSFANNHTMDFSYDGLFDTLDAAKKRNLPICGAGKDLAEASDYIVIDTDNGKCALISICATFNDAARAGNPSDYLQGRPGLNPLRFSIEYRINSEHMKALREISAATHIDGRRNRSRMGGYTPMPPEGCFGFGEYNFRECETEGKFSRVNKVDMERTEMTIKKALAECENVVVNIHSHEIKHDTDDEPDDFLIEFCRKCIDAGASCVIGTGTHQLKAIEIYKEKPIFYSLGNFIFQSDMVFCMPDDFREKYKMPYGLTARQQIAERAKLGNGGLHNDVNNFRSLMPFMTFEDRKLTSLVLYPLRLDMHTGFPALADEEETEIIYNYLCDRNKQFGTEIEITDGKIEVKIQ
ncbi:MAG: CapA family protein [Ruminococcaceae bacterium]|nr:CapA family protein [Oscillospiraceae bacterium]